MLPNYVVRNVTLVPIFSGNWLVIVSKRNLKSGFSVLEIISALVILAVVTGAAVATLTPIRDRPSEYEMIEEISYLNNLSQDYRTKTGRHPKSVNDLVRNGYLPISGPGAADRIRRIRQNYDYAPATGLFSRQ